MVDTGLFAGIRDTVLATEAVAMEAVTMGADATASVWGIIVVDTVSASAAFPGMARGTVAVIPGMVCMEGATRATRS